MSYNVYHCFFNYPCNFFVRDWSCYLHIQSVLNFDFFVFLSCYQPKIEIPFYSAITHVLFCLCGWEERTGSKFSMDICVKANKTVSVSNLNLTVQSYFIHWLMLWKASLVYIKINLTSCTRIRFFLYMLKKMLSSHSVLFKYMITKQFGTTVIFLNINDYIWIFFHFENGFDSNGIWFHQNIRVKQSIVR